MKNLIRKILKESIDNRKLNYGLSLIEKGRVQPPYDKGLELLGFDDDDIKEILDELTHTLLKNIKNIQPPYFKQLKNYGLTKDEIGLLIPKIFKKKGLTWDKFRGYGNSIIDNRGDEIYDEDINGYWFEQKFDRKGRIIYRRTPEGWYKLEYDKNGNTIYWENSNDGVLIDKR